MKTFKEFAKSKGKKADAVTHNEEPEMTVTHKVTKDGKRDDLTDLQAKISKKHKLKDGEFKLVSILDVSTTDPCVANDTLGEAVIISGEFGNNDLKRNDLVYITAMVKRQNYSANSMAVFKVRVIDIYQGLSFLNTLK